MAAERIVADPRHGVVFDPRRAPGLEPSWFDPAYWRERQALRALAGGRGGVFVITTPVGEGVLRHYRRGGLVARLVDDRFLWTGENRVRSVCEFRLLQHLVKQGLPVPRPIGGAWWRSGGRYRADLITEHLADTESVAQALAIVAAQPDVARRIGACVGRFHRHGAYHADLNAHNILLAADGAVSLIDFDRGRLRTPHPDWWQANLARLHRSLRKLAAAGDGRSDWLPGWWQALTAAHAQTTGRT